MKFDLSKKEIEFYKDRAFAAKPYTEDDPEPYYYDECADYKRINAAMAIRWLKRRGLRTEEDEKRAFEK